ncbi:MAG: hypothetical protein NZ941_04375, partial [Candidatus Caldarchaeum sp.]|nr:hypothetical protein [Candidatus Caldarchaeum sp.]
SEYVAKYEAKPVFELEEEGEGVSFEALVSLEAALYGRKLFEVWGLSELEQKGEDGEFVYLGIASGVSCELEINNLHRLPRLVEELRRSRDGPVKPLCWAVVRVKEFVEGTEHVFSRRCYAYYDEGGRIWLFGDERFEEVVWSKVV